MSKSKSLGKGLEALIQRRPVHMEPRGEAPAAKPLEDGQQIVSELAIETLRRNPEQPRREFIEESLQELSDSIRENGILQPLLAFEDGGLVTIIAGERRFRAAKMAGLNSVPVILRPRPSERELMQMAILENVQREDLNPVDLAEGYRTLIEEHAMTQEQLAQALGVNRVSVTHVLRLNKLPSVIKSSVRDGRISFGHAKVLSGLTVEDDRVRLWERCVKRSWSVRQLEEKVREHREGGAKAKSPIKTFDILQAEEDLTGHLGAKTQISPNPKRGQIRIDYHTKEELDRLVELLGNL
jgi:ParB family transcriptional regulator, chromosome partitioning protein